MDYKIKHTNWEPMLEVERGKITSFPDLPTTFNAILSTQLDEESDNAKQNDVKVKIPLPNIVKKQGKIRMWLIILIPIPIGQALPPHPHAHKWHGNKLVANTSVKIKQGITILYFLRKQTH